MKPPETRVRSTVASVSSTSKHFSVFQAQQIYLSLVLAMLLAAPVVAFAQQTASRSISFPTQIQWTRQKGVATYRVQIASDENFRSIFFDGRVNGERYTVTGLPPGYYYWRAAAADRATGRFSKPVRFFISGGAVSSVTPRDKATRRTRLRSVANSH